MLPRVLVAVLVAFAGGLVVPVHSGSPWPASISAQARALVAQMTQDEKIALLHGDGLPFPYVGNVPELSRLHVPAQALEDGPQGVADDVSLVTAWPSAFTVACAWDVAAQAAFGQAMAEEEHAKGANIHLAPACNLARVPWGGRTFEYLGEDPFLASRLVAAEVAGIQSVHGVSACIKHLAVNSQETERQSMSSNVGDRALHELYLPAFSAAVDAGVGTAMCAYCRVNLTYACENAALLQWLKGPAGFAGPVMSDWYATHSTIAAANAGLDQEMPAGFFFSSALAAAVAAGSVPQSRVDDAVTRVLTPMLALGLFDDPPSPSRNIFVNATSAAHNALAASLATTTLLQNERGVLPLDATAPRLRVAVFGDEDTVAGGGSGGVNRPYTVTPREGIARVLADAGNAGATVTYVDGTNATAAAAAARAADVAVVVVATTSEEGSDRPTLALPPWQDALVVAVAAANARTVVVARCPGACGMPWAAAVPAILFQGMGGQEAGTALARAIFGVTPPAGKLPVTFPAPAPPGEALPIDTWLSPAGGGPVIPSSFPGVDRGRGFLEAEYDEGLFMGYRCVGR